MAEFLDDVADLLSTLALCAIVAIAGAALNGAIVYVTLKYVLGLP